MVKVFYTFKVNFSVIQSVLYKIVGNHIQFHWFTCGGEGSQRDMRLHPDGFVMNGEMDVAAEYTGVWKRLRNPLILFGRNFDLDSALLVQSKLLFQMARCVK
jgi:hypothetical protein